MSELTTLPPEQACLGGDAHQHGNTRTSDAGERPAVVNCINVRLAGLLGLSLGWPGPRTLIAVTLDGSATHDRSPTARPTGSPDTAGSVHACRRIARGPRGQ